MYKKEAYAVIDLIGSLPDESRKSNKIDGYYQPTNGILIRDFAIDFFGINSRNVKILAYGTKQDYDIYIHTNNKCYYQIDFNNFFQMDINSSQIDFDYFIKFDDAITKIEDIISENKQKTILLFLDDHGFKGYFSQIVYFRLYEIIMKFQDNNFIIFNDSCFSGSFIDLIQSYDFIFTQKIKNNIDEIDPCVLFSFLNLFNHVLKEVDMIKPIETVTQLINFFHSITIDSDNLLNMILSINISDSIDPNESVEKICHDEQIMQCGFKNVIDVKNFKIIVNCCEIKKENNKDDLFNCYKNLLNKPNLEMFLKLSNDDLNQFIQKLKTLYIARNMVHFKLKPNKNIEILTSTDNEHKCLSFASIRTNDVTKVYPGSPAMSAFIKEIFMRSHKDSINFNNIIKELTEIDGKTLFFPMRVNQQFKMRKHKQWIHLYPEHYNEVKCNFALTYTNELLKKVAALRAISFINVNKMTKVANSLSSTDTPFYPSHSNDSNADIVATAALLSNYENIPVSILDEFIYSNKSLIDHNPQGFHSASLIILASFKLSKKPLDMVSLIVNILENVAKKVIYDKLILISKSKKSYDIPNEIGMLFTRKEIDMLFVKLHKSQINLLDENNLSLFYSTISNDKHFKFVFDIEKAIIALFTPSSIFFAILIASYILDEMNIESIEELSNDYLLSSSDKSFTHFLNNDFLKINPKDTNENIKAKDKKNKNKAENYLYAHAIASLICVNSTCDLQIKIDSMKIVSDQFQQIETFSLIYILLNVFEGNDKLFISDIIDQIEHILSKEKISSFLIPSIIALLPIKIPIYALYLFVSSVHKDWYSKILKKMENIKNKDEYKIFHDDILVLFEKKLKKKKDINEEKKHNEDIVNTKIKISKSIQKSVIMIEKLCDISIYKARENISKRMNINILKSQVKSIVDILPISFDNAKFFHYLSSSTSSLNKAVMFYNEFKINNCPLPNITFLDYETINNTTNIFKRASEELKTVAYLFKISNISYEPENDIYSDKFNEKHKFYFCVSAMAARAFNIVEIVPIIKKMEIYSEDFDPSEGLEPSLRELMGLHSAMIHILTPKDQLRNRYKLESLKEENNSEYIRKIQILSNDETDSYYSSDYYEENDSITFRSVELEESNTKKICKKETSIFQQQSIEKYKIYQISDLRAAYARDELNLGHLDWEGDVWKAFVYCFNIRLEKIEIQFNPKEDYSEISYPISIIDIIRTVAQFYPIINVNYIWQNQDRIERFIGKYSNKANKIFQAFIQSFDDVDRIVTPIYMRRRTYQIRTVDTLKLIYDC